jgi:hypothetical protein
MPLCCPLLAAAVHIFISYSAVIMGKNKYIPCYHPTCWVYLLDDDRELHHALITLQLNVVSNWYTPGTSLRVYN